MTHQKPHANLLGCAQAQGTGRRWAHEQMLLGIQSNSSFSTPSAHGFLLSRTLKKQEFQEKQPLG
jgi:uncharacterized protein YgiB involved in biofilm formation